MMHIDFRRALRSLLVCATLLVWLPAAMAGAAAEDEGAEDIAAPPSAVVRIDGRSILRVRGFVGLPAEERARAIERRIVDFASSRAIPSAALTLEDGTRGTAVKAGTVTLLTVTDADAALEDLSRQALAQAVRDLVGQSVELWREERSTERRLHNAGWALGATLVLGIVLFILVRASRRLREYVRTRVASRVRSVGVQSFEILTARHLTSITQATPGFLFWVAVAASVYVYLHVVLGLFPLTRPIGNRLMGLVADPLRTLGLELVDALPNLAFLAVLVVVVRYVLKLMRLYFDAVERGVVRFEQFDAEWAIPTYKVLRIFVVAFALVVAYPYIPGSESAAFKGVSVMLGVLFSLGSSSVIGNVIAGYSMTYRRAFRRGDRIRVGSVTGDVVESRVLVTTLRTPKNELVVVPNSEILGSSVVNFSALARERGLILHTTVGIGYETPWRQVEAMLLIAASRTEGLKREPAPFVLQTALGDFCVTYELNAYTDNPQIMPRLYSALHANILDVFNEHSVQIMTPSYEADTPEPKVVGPGDWYKAPARPPAAPEAPSTGLQ